MGGKQKLILIGGKGNGTLLASLVEDIIAGGGPWELLGFLNDGDQDVIDGYPVLGRPEAAQSFAQEDCFFLYALLSAKLSIPRVERLKSLGLPRERFATLVHPTAQVSRSAKLGHGVLIGPFTFIGPNARLGDHILVHGHSYIGRDTVLHDYSYVAPRGTVGAEVVVEEGAYLGLGCKVDCIRGPVTVGAWSVVGMGSVVIDSVAPYQKVVGVPAHPIGTVDYRVGHLGSPGISPGDE